MDSTTEETVSWHQFEKSVGGKIRKWQRSTCLLSEYKQTTPLMLITLLKPKLTEFVVNNFEPKWQDNMFKKCLGCLTTDHIISPVDYAENYSFQW
jgi:hypothetical protein